MKWKGRMKHNVLIILIITFIFMNPQQPQQIIKAKEKESSLAMATSINFNQNVKCNRLANVLITLKNQEDGFEGYLQAILEKRNSQDNCLYENEIMVKPKEVQSFHLSIPISETLEYVTFQITDIEKHILVQERKKVNIGAEGSIFYLGVIGDGMDYIRGIEGKPFKPIAIPDDEIPVEADGLDMFDGIYIGCKYIEKQRVSQLKPILQWNAKGGTVVLGCESTAIENYFGIDSSDAIQVNDEDGSCMYYVYKIGQGVLVEWAASLDFDQTMKQNREYAKKLIDNMQTHYSDIQLDRLYRDSCAKDDEKLLIKSLEITESDYLPRPLVYAVIIMLYAILVGPVLFLVLKKLKKNLWYYGGVAVCSSIFIVIFLIAGSNTRIKSPIVHSITIYNYEENQDTEKEETYFSIVMPNTGEEVFSIQKESDIEFKDAVFQTTSSVAKHDSSENCNVFVTKNKMNSEVTIKEPLYMKPYIFKSSSDEARNGEVKYQLLYNGEKITGNIKNELGFDLEDAFVLSNYQVIPIGLLENGDKFQIPKEQKSVSYNQMDRNINRIIEDLTGIKGAEEQRNLLNYRKYSTMLYCLKNKCLKYNNETYLVGFVKKNTIARDADSTIGNEDVGLVIYHLENVQKRYEGKKLITDIAKYENRVSGEYDPVTHVMEGGSVVMSYYLPTSLNIQSIMYLETVNKENDFKGTISIYDNKNHEYQDVLCEGKDSMINNLYKHHFISESNKIIVKYTCTGETAEDGEQVIPALSAVVEAK